MQEVRQDVRENSDNEGDEIKACGIPLKLGKLTLGNLKYSFWSTSRSKSPREVNANANINTNASSDHHHKKAPGDGSGVSENSDDLFWSDEVRIIHLVPTFSFLGIFPTFSLTFIAESCFHRYP